MNVWEYLVLGIAIRGFDTEETLNRLGEDGWELVAISEGTCFFKRLKNEFSK